MAYSVFIISFETEEGSVEEIEQYICDILDNAMTTQRKSKLFNYCIEENITDKSYDVW